MKPMITKLVMIATLVLVIPSAAQSEDNYSINITSPEHKGDVEWHPWVGGKTSLPSNSEYNIYVLINPVDSSSWWVQPKAILYDDGTWEAYVYFGRRGMDEDTWYTACAIVTSSELGEDTLDNIPENLAKSDYIRVRRI